MPIQNLTPQEIQVLQQLGLDPDSIDLEKQIQKVLDVATTWDNQSQNVNDGDSGSPLQDNKTITPNQKQILENILKKIKK